MSKFIKLLVLSTLILTSFNLFSKDSNFVAEKRIYEVSDSVRNYKFTVWIDNKNLAIRFNKDNKAMLWQNWQSKYPSSYQLFLKESYKIEFESSQAVAFKTLYQQVKALAIDNKASKELGMNKNIYLIKQVAEGEAKKEIKSWANFIEYDHADIGDNEADTVLAKLIYQGFKKSL